VVCTKRRLSIFSRHWSSINSSSREDQTALTNFFKARRAANIDFIDDVNNFQEFQFLRNNVKYNRIQVKINYDLIKDISAHAKGN